MRFPITTPLLFREHGESQWKPGATVNLSHSGVLFRADPPLPAPGRALDFILTLPMDGMTPARVHCTGRVVRTALQELAGGGVAVAATIDRYVFGRRVPVAVPVAEERP